MYVFVTISELTGADKQLPLGQVEDDVTLDALLARCLDHVDKRLPEQDRDDSRHFWFNDRLIPFERKYLRDLASTVNVALELRPDHYQVELPGHAPERYAINPELSVATAIDSLMGQAGASRCYQLLPHGGQPLKEDASLFQQETLPFHARLSQKETELLVRRKPEITLWSLLLAAAFIGGGLLLGFLYARFAG